MNQSKIARSNRSPNSPYIALFADIVVQIVVETNHLSIND